MVTKLHKFPIKNFIAKKPIVCVFEATRKCNSRCGMGALRETPRGRLMGLEELKNVFSKIKKAGVFEVYVQGGEPLLHPHIIEILGFLNENFDTRIVTNGILLNEKMQGFLVRENIGITISLDSLDRERYSKIRGTDSLGRVLENIETLAKKNYGNVSLHCTVSDVNKGEVFGLRAFARKKGFFFSALPYISNVGCSGKEAKGLKYKNRELIKIFTNLAKKERREDFFASLVYSDVANFLYGKNLGPCDALDYSVYLTQDGLISPCIEKPAFADLKKEPSLARPCKDATQRKLVQNCHEKTPCYHGYTRGIYALRKNIISVLRHPLLSHKSFVMQTKFRRAGEKRQARP